MTVRMPSEGEVIALTRSLQVDLDPLSIFEKVCDGGLKADTLLLESGQAGERSLIVFSSALRFECRGRDVAVHALTANGASLIPWLAVAMREHVKDEDSSLLRLSFPLGDGGDEESRLLASSPMDAIRSLFRGLRLPSSEAYHVPFVAGVLGYDLIGSFESLPPAAEDHLGWPAYELWLPEQFAWMDHATGRITLVCHVFGGDNAERSYHASVGSMRELESAFDRISRPDASSPISAKPAEAAVDLDDEEYVAMVERMKEHIRSGDVFQIVLSRTFSCACENPVAAYRALRSLNPSPYMFFVNGTRGILFGASPETALKVDGMPRRVTIRPIAGTRPRGRHADGSIDADADSRLEAELRLDEKELAEHMMLVDLGRNDVARVSRAGTRRVDRLLTVERYSHVMHLVSEVSGELRDDLDALHAYVATMNMGTLVGAPKVRAAELLRRYERTARGAYGGAVAYFSADGRMDSAVIIRSAVVTAGRAYVRSGAGIVFDSVASEEASETRRKASAVLAALGAGVSGR